MKVAEVFFDEPIGHDSVTSVPPADGSLTDNQRIVMDVADVIGTPPPEIGQDFLDLCNRVASLLNVSIERELRSSVSDVKVDIQRIVTPVSPTEEDPSDPAEPVDSPVAIRNAALSYRSAIFSFFDAVTSFIATASNAGLVPPDNPFVVIAGLDAARRNEMSMIVQSAGTEFFPQGNSAYPVKVTAQQADDLVFNMGAFVQLIKAQKQGKIDVDQVAKDSAQIGSFSFSLAGLGSSGDPAVDLLRFIPSADEIRAQKNLELLSAFDFRKRVPRIVFIADYDVLGKRSGAIIGWKRISDASGYVIKKVSVFERAQATLQVTNADLETSRDSVGSYVEKFVSPFYDDIDFKNVCLYLDTGVSTDQMYRYSVQAFQTRMEEQGRIFTVPTSPSSFSLVNRNKVQASLSSLANQYFGDSATGDDVNPWPVLSSQVFGDSRFDWILAAVNFRAALNRGESLSDAKDFSYLGARVSSLFSAMDSGRFVLPTSVDDIISGINSAVSRFGVGQTVSEVFQETGILYYLEGSEPANPDGFNRAGVVDVGRSPALSAVFSAIDPQTTTLDLRVLGENMLSTLNDSGFSSRTEVMGVRPPASSSPVVPSTAQEIVVPDIGASSAVVAQGDIQFLVSLPSKEDSVIDLTNFDGISKLVRCVRLFSDSGPGRGGGMTVAEGVVPQQAQEPPAPPPTGPVFLSTSASGIQGIDNVRSADIVQSPVVPSSGSASRTLSSPKKFRIS